MQLMVPNINGTMGHKIKNQKPSKTWNTVRYRAPNKQQPSTILPKKCKYGVWASVKSHCMGFVVRSKLILFKKWENLRFSEKIY